MDAKTIVAGGLVGGSVAFWYLSRASTSTLLAIVCLFMGAAVCAWTLARAPPQPQRVPEGEEGQAGLPIASASYAVKRFPGSGRLRHLRRHAELLAVAEDLAFVRKFDEARYTSLAVHLDAMAKVYTYMLGGRYHFSSFATFVDLRDACAEILYSLALVVPTALKHTYGIAPHETLRRRTSDFLALSRRMSDVLERYGRGQRERYVPPTLPRPAHDAALGPHRLP